MPIHPIAFIESDTLFSIFAVDFFNRNLQLDTIASGSNFAPEAAQAFPSTFDRSGSRSFVPARVQDDPDFVRSILGSTVAGRELRMGEMGKQTSFKSKRQF